LEKRLTTALSLAFSALKVQRHAFPLAAMRLAGYGGAGRSIRSCNEMEKAFQEQRW
jgi:hypothetical protein